MRLAFLTSIILSFTSGPPPQSAQDSVPPMGARVRVIAARLGPEWQIGLFNQLQISSSCHRVLLFTPTGALRVRAMLAPGELKRLQVAVRHGRVRNYNPATRGASVAGEQWREVPLTVLEPSTRACEAAIDSMARRAP
jgi:hypothetical protein